MQQPITPDNYSFDWQTFADERGTLSVSNLSDGEALPFEVGRVFWITNVPEGQKRGTHAHRSCHEALVCLQGSFKVKVDNGCGVSFVQTLDSPQKGLYIPPMVWCELYDFTPDAVCLCLASGPYDKEGYLATLEAWQAAL